MTDDNVFHAFEFPEFFTGLEGLISGRIGTDQHNMDGPVILSLPSVEPNRKSLEFQHLLQALRIVQAIETAHLAIEPGLK